MQVEARGVSLAAHCGYYLVSARPKFYARGKEGGDDQQVFRAPSHHYRLYSLHAAALGEHLGERLFPEWKDRLFS